MGLPYNISKETIAQAKPFVEKRRFAAPFYFKLKYRLFCLFPCAALAVFIPKGYAALLLFFLADYLLYRAHGNYVAKEQIAFLENFLETQSLEEKYIEGIDHCLQSEKLSGERLTYNFIRKKKLDEFMKKYNSPEAKLLDVGCSGGWLTESYKSFPNYKNLFGVDLNQPGLRIYKTTHPDISPPVLGNVEKLPFKNESLDLIFATDIIEHLLRPDLFLKEVRRVLKPDGIFYLSTNNAHYIPFSYLINPLIVLEKISGLYFPFVLPVRNLLYGDEHASERYYHTDFERKDFLKLLTDAGFKIHYVKSFNFYWDFFAPLGEKVKNTLPVKIYMILGKALEMLPVFKYTGEHWYIELKASGDGDGTKTNAQCAF